MSELAELVARTFATRDASHLLHWRTRSYAAHKAICDFYDALPDKIDGIVEMHQGLGKLLGDVEQTTLMFSGLGEMVVHLTKEAEWISANRDDISDDVEAIENALDDLAGTYLRTAYMLRFLS